MDEREELEMWYSECLCQIDEDREADIAAAKARAMKARTELQAEYNKKLKALLHKKYS